MQLPIHDRRRVRLDEGITRGPDHEVEGLWLEAMVGLYEFHVERGSQDGQLLVGGRGLRERFDEVAGNEIHAIHGGGPEKNDPPQDRRSGGGMETAGASKGNAVGHGHTTSR
jgi:hypothetical protein